MVCSVNIYFITLSLKRPTRGVLKKYCIVCVETCAGETLTRVVYKTWQPAKFAGFSARFRWLLSFLHESRYLEEMMFIRFKPPTFHKTPATCKLKVPVFMIKFSISTFLHFRTQQVFPSYLAKFQTITNITTHVF